MPRRILFLSAVAVSVFLFASRSLDPAGLIHAQTPIPTPIYPSPPYTPPLNPQAYPCTQNSLPSFHPLRPYPANPCDPYIPRKIPEAKDNPPNDLYLSFNCSPSVKAQGTFSVPDVVDISYLPPFPTNSDGTPNYTAASLDTRYICPGTLGDICFIHHVTFNLALNYSASQFPVLGNTQNFLLDQDNVNNYLDSYLNGTIQQAEPQGAPSTGLSPIYRLENFSGPVKKLLSRISQQTLRNSMITGQFGVAYHDYHISGHGVIYPATLLSGANPANVNVPFASQEDITGEVTVSLPSELPVGLDGFVVPGTIGLGIDYPSDSRLYFAHLRDANVLSDVLASTSRPYTVYTNPSFPPVDVSSHRFTSQIINPHQGLNPGDNTPVETFDYLTGSNTRNTEVIEGNAAPPALYDSGSLCDMSIGPTIGDNLVGSTIHTTLSFTMYFHYTPRLVIDNFCPTSLASCVNRPCADAGEVCADDNSRPQCCTVKIGLGCPARPPGHCNYAPGAIPSVCQYLYNADCPIFGSATCEDPTHGGCCNWIQPAPTCPAWPHRDLVAAGDFDVFTKTPLIERIYNTLVASASSVMHRFAPYSLSPNSSSPTAVSFASGRDALPGATTAQYTASSNDLQNVSVASPPELYFADLGSLFNHFLGNGGIAENLNLQCFLRPKGSCTTPLQCADFINKLTQNTTSSCGLCNADSEIGPLGRSILTTAGNAFNVSASDIWTTMWHEGRTWPEYAGQFTDANVLKWSLPVSCGGEPMPKCNNDDPLTQPPFGFIKYWFYEDSDSLWRAVETIDPTRNTKALVSRCNFLDAAFAIAKELHIQAASHVNETCGAYHFTDTVRPTSCNWTDTKFAQSQVGFGGQCPDGPIYYPPKPPYNISDLVSMWHGYRCQ